MGADEDRAVPRDAEVSAHVIPAWSVAFNRDVKAGTPAQQAMEKHVPPEVRERMMAAMRGDVLKGREAFGIGDAFYRETFTAMGCPDNWIDEVLK